MRVVKRTAYIPPHPDFKTAYSQEEHIRRIEERTEAIFAEEIADETLVSYEVEILHSFYDDDPEYFLVEVEYAEECIVGAYDNPNYSQTTENQEQPFIRYTTKYQHLIGFIISDEYYITKKNAREVFMNGRSGYALCEYPDNKKYCGGGTWKQGVEVDGQIVLTATTDCIRLHNGSSYEFHRHYKDEKCPVGEVIPTTQYKALMNFGEIQAGAPKFKYERIQ